MRKLILTIAIMLVYEIAFTIAAMQSVDTWRYVSSSLQTTIAAGMVAAFYFVDLDHRDAKADPNYDVRPAWMLAGIALFTGFIASLLTLPLMLVAHLVLEQFGYVARN